MDYITSQEAAIKWGLTRRTVQLYCQSGKIPGAINPGKQWLIPVTAEKPQDSRFSKNKCAPEVDSYHFPLLVYSRHYQTVSDLSDDEKALLDAQDLNIKCNFVESIRCCRKLISESHSPSVLFGAWFTNVSNFMLLGLSSEIPACLNAMESICSSAKVHQEDYRLLLAFFDHSYLFDASRFMTIDVSKLSFDAITTYEVMSLGVCLFSGKKNQESALKCFEAACRQTELLGITPASITMHSLIAMLYSVNGNSKEKLRHMDDACRIGFESGITRLLAKCFSLDIDNFSQCMSKYDSAFSEEIHNKCLQYRNNWKNAYTTVSGPNPAINLNIFEHEIALLLINNMSMADIAELKNITVKEVKSTIKDLCERMGLNSNEELANLFISTFGSVPRE